MLKITPQVRKAMAPSLKNSLDILQMIKERAIILYEQNSDSKKNSVFDYFLEAKIQLKKEGLI